jgi:hypothetical protein
MFPSYFKYNTDKFQRLGVLKVLVALLDPQRRSQATDSIVRNLTKALDLKQPRADREFGDEIEEESRGALLVKEADCTSLNFRFTKKSAYEIINWGKLYGFIGAGNQITERGLLLRHLMGEAAVKSILDNTFEVNPFRLTLEEKIYFLFRHFEVDTTIHFVIRRIAAESWKEGIRGVEADKIVCRSLYDLYLLSKENRRGFDAMSLQDEIPLRIGSISQRPSRPNIKPEQKNKKRTKTADHEAISRFEFLADLGLVRKPTGISTESDKKDPRKSWHYWPTPDLYNLVARLQAVPAKDFCYHAFASAVTSIVPPAGLTFSPVVDRIDIARRAYEAYLIVKRVFGHTPLESVATVAMIRALADSTILEMAHIHGFFLNLKIKDSFPGIVHFAAGNEMDRMFIDIKPSFLNEFRSTNDQSS